MAKKTTRKAGATTKADEKKQTPTKTTKSKASKAVKELPVVEPEKIEEVVTKVTPKKNAKKANNNKKDGTPTKTTKASTKTAKAKADKTEKVTKSKEKETKKSTKETKVNKAEKSPTKKASKAAATVKETKVKPPSKATKRKASEEPKPKTKKAKKSNKNNTESPILETEIEVIESVETVETVETSPVEEEFHDVVEEIPESVVLSQPENHQPENHNNIEQQEPEHTIVPEVRSRSDSESSYQTANYHFESSALEKLQQETMAPAPFNINDSYLSSTSVAPPLYSPPLSRTSESDSFPPQTPIQASPSPMSNPLMLSPPQSNSGSSSSHSSTSSNSQDIAHDLPAELLNAGWRKYWSRREGRFYYFNKTSNQSMWELPKLGYDPTRDPLGIAHSSNFHPPPSSGNDPTSPSMIPANAFQPFVHVPKTVPIGGDSSTDIKRNYVGPFDFEIDSNVYTWEGFVFYFYHAHPEAELMRSSLVNKLRQQYYELCHSRQSLDAPKDSFTRWILERKTSDKGCDPFLPSECNAELSETLFHEIMNDIPVKIHKPKYSGEARKQLSRYAEAAKQIIEHAHVSPQSRKTVKWNVEDAFEWIRRTLNATYEDYIERLEHLREQCQPHIIEASQQSVKSICLKLYHTSIEYAKRIRDVNTDVFKKEDLRERGIIRFQHQKKVLCYPAYLVNPCPKLPLVQIFTDQIGNVRLIYKNGENVKISRLYMQKLEMLYYFNCRDDRKYTVFPPRVWCMLMRYYSFYNQKEGMLAQGSLPLSVFAALNKHFEVTFECFASPLNCYFRQYCSLFPDTDGYFGSRGSILNFFPITGSFQANPPDCEELIEVTISHFDKLLENSNEPLSFILFIHETPEMTAKIIPRLEGNKFKRTNVVIKAEEHEYRHGFQHLYHPFDSLTEACSNTLIYFLQNDAGFMKWGPMPERIEGLVESFKRDADREISFANVSAPVSSSAPEVIQSNGHGDN